MYIFKCPCSNKDIVIKDKILGAYTLRWCDMESSFVFYPCSTVTHNKALVSDGQTAGRRTALPLGGTMNISDVLHKRCLLKLGTGRWIGQEVTEYRILEISPSGTWVKLMNLNGNKFWRSVSDVAFIEELVDLKAGKPS